MKERLISTGALLCLAVLVILLLMHALAIYPGPAAIGRFIAGTAEVLGRLDAPAWVQAVGSVLAILVAVAVPMWQRQAERARTREADTAVAMVIGFEISSKVTMAIAAAEAMQFEYDNPTHPDPRDRARFLSELFDTLQLPAEEQLLLLSRGMPELAVAIAGGRAAINRVRLTLNLIEKQSATGPAELSRLEGHFLGTRVNLMEGLSYLITAKERIEAFNPQS